MIDKTNDFESTKDSSTLCLTCGLCCDGTLIGFVALDTEELPRLKKIMSIEEANNSGFLLQPCKSYCNGCTIYLERPTACDKYNCKLLDAVEEQEIPLNEAIKVTDEVKAMQTAIIEKVALLDYTLKSPSFYFRMIELKKIVAKNKAENKATQNELDLISELHTLDVLLLEKFGLTF